MAQILNTNADMMAGDTGTTLVISVTNAGSAYDLTGASVSLQWLNQQSILQKRSMTITNASGGVCNYTFAQSDTFPGSMVFQIVVTTSAGTNLTSIQTVSLLVGTPL